MRNIPQVTKALLIVNIAAFLVCVAVGGPQVSYGGATYTDYILNERLGLYFFKAPGFEPYQLVTYMFMHGGWDHLFFNMFALWMFGRVVEHVWGPKKFLFYYILCGIGAGLAQEAAQYLAYIGAFGQPILNTGTTVGASGAIYAILLAFGMIFPNERIFIFPLPVPIKAKWFVIGYAAIELFMAFHSSGDGVAHTAHLGGMLFGFFLIRYWQKHPSANYGRSNGQQFFDKLRNSWEQQSNRKAPAPDSPSKKSSNRDIADSNASRQREEEIDRILDKIRKSGYDSLSREEKQRLFDQNQNSKQ
ncbi:MAG: rhomboid family intramembrane serine protease [Prevotella sp.]|nr:rhomboid family intramembrane serine protease [Prevotella sp.]